jgi:hypothetical protein
MPRVASAYWSAGLAAFGADLTAALEGSDKNPADPESKGTFVNAGPAHVVSEVDDFVDVVVRPTATTLAQQVTPNPRTLIPTPFPKLSAIPRPDTLLRQPPYHLIMRSGGEQVFVEGHPPSVDLIREYLMQHARQSNELEVQLLQGPWGVAVNQLQVGMFLATLTPALIVDVGSVVKAFWQPPRIIKDCSDCPS